MHTHTRSYTPKGKELTGGLDEMCCVSLLTSAEPTERSLTTHCHKCFTAEISRGTAWSVFSITHIRLDLLRHKTMKGHIRSRDKYVGNWVMMPQWNWLPFSDRTDVSANKQHSWVGLVYVGGEGRKIDHVKPLLPTEGGQWVMTQGCHLLSWRLGVGGVMTEE